MTIEILTTIVETLDLLDVFDHLTGINPILLLDGHGSRFELPFLNYINYSDHIWFVLMGFPYGTIMWKVGDSVEQDGAYTIALAKKKKKSLQRRHS